MIRMKKNVNGICNRLWNTGSFYFPQKVGVISPLDCTPLISYKENILFQTSRGEENMPLLLAISLSRELSGLSFSEI